MGQGQQQQQQQGAGQLPAPGAAAAAGGQAEVWDAYTPLDMHSKGSLPIKPMQVRRPPRGRPLKPVVVARKQGAAQLSRAAAAAGLAHPEFAYGLELAGPSSSGRGRRGAPAGPSGQYVAHSVLEQGEGTAAAAAELQGDGVGVGWGAGGEEGAAQGGGGWDGEDGDDGGGAGGGPDDDDDGGGGLDAVDLLHDVGAHRGSAALPWGEGGEGAEGEAGSSYEDLCRAHMEAMTSAAAAQEVQSELAQRVSGWRTKIDPVLKDEESRSNFDIQLYAERIISRLQEAAPAQGASGAALSSSGFEAVAKEEVTYEVSRTFAAMLQLINNRNIELVQEGSSPDAPFQLHLLVAQLPHKRMGEALQGNIVASGASAAAEAASGGSLHGEGGAAAAGGAGTKRPPKKKAKDGSGGG